MGRNRTRQISTCFALLLSGCWCESPSQNVTQVQSDGPCPTGSVFKEGLPADDVLCDDCKVSACVTPDERKNGPWFEYYPDGQTKAEGQYKKGKKDGKWTHWYSNGQKEEEMEYRDGKQHGNWAMWYENGKPWRSHQFKDGAIHGVRTDWNPDGTVFSKQVCNELPCGYDDGVHMEWHSNGQLFITGEFKDNKMHGKWSYRTENGTVRMSEQCDMVADRLTGKCDVLCDSVEACAKMKD